MRGRQHDGRVHLVEKRTSLSEEFLPDWVLEGIAASLGARVQARIGPDVTYFIRLTGLSLPEADDSGSIQSADREAAQRRCPGAGDPLWLL